MDDHLKSTLIELERHGWSSLCDGTGGEFYGGLMTEDAVMVLANGQTLGRDEVVASLQDAPPWRSFEMDRERVVRCGPETAVLVYVGTAYREGSEPEFVGAMSSVYTLHGGQWRLALYQQTPIPPSGS